MEKDFWVSHVWLMSGEDLQKYLPPPEWAMLYSHYIAQDCKLGASPACVEERISKYDWEGKQAITKAVENAAAYLHKQERRDEEDLSAYDSSA